MIIPIYRNSRAFGLFFQNLKRDVIFPKIYEGYLVSGNAENSGLERVRDVTGKLVTIALARL